MQLESEDKQGIIAYDGDRYRKGRGEVKSARREIDALPLTKSTKCQLLNIAGQITGSLLQQLEAIDQLSLSNEAKAQFLNVLEKVLKGTVASTQAIYITPAASGEIETIARRGSGGSSTDLQTDQAGLKELPHFFDPGKLTSED